MSERVRRFDFHWGRDVYRYRYRYMAIGFFPRRNHQCGERLHRFVLEVSFHVKRPFVMVRVSTIPAWLDEPSAKREWMYERFHLTGPKAALIPDEAKR